MATLQSVVIEKVSELRYYAHDILKILFNKQKHTLWCCRKLFEWNYKIQSNKSINIDGFCKNCMNMCNEWNLFKMK